MNYQNKGIPKNLQTPVVLCVDNSSADQKAIKLQLSRLTRAKSVQLVFASSIGEALRILSDQLIHVVLLDIDLRPEDDEETRKPRVQELTPAVNGVYAIQQIKNIQSHIEIIMVTGHSQADAESHSKRLGALSLLEKRNLAELCTNVEWALKLSGQRLAQIAQAFGSVDSIPYIVGVSEQAILERSRIAAAVRTPRENILILGEPGSGKTSRAKWIHTLRGMQMGKLNRPFVNVNVSAWSEGMMDRELFGHRKGSFTGAISDGKGAIERAEGGTLFLDEIGELPLDLQSRLLKLLQERVFTPLGGSQQIANCDVIAATNCDISRAVENGEFRQDLAERFSIVIRIAPLYERKGDLRYILRSVLRGLSHRFPDSKLAVEDIPADLMKTIERLDIRGGYRVLENIFSALILFSADNPFTGERDYSRWREIPEVTTPLFNSKPVARNHPKPLKSGPVTLEEIRERGFDVVGTPEFTNLPDALESIKEKIYEDAWEKYKENKAVAQALGVAAATACHYTSRIKRQRPSSIPTSPGLRTQVTPKEAEENAL